jgi:hypothetical protein
MTGARKRAGMVARHLLAVQSLLADIDSDLGEDSALQVFVGAADSHVEAALDAADSLVRALDPSREMS